jgi:preprotein translocase subunit SecA
MQEIQYKDGKRFQDFFNEHKALSKNEIKGEVKNFAEGLSKEMSKAMDRRLEEVKAEHGEPEQVIRRKVGRNEPCPCGSGVKFKKCHLNKAI